MVMVIGFIARTSEGVSMMFKCNGFDYFVIIFGVFM